MGFVENLRKKIDINRLADQVIRSWGPPDNPRRMDREAMKRLLAMSDLTYLHERDLDLYVHHQDDEKPLVLVLDNELKLYHTDVADVAMRKSPTVKEMVSIRNAIKILNDKDVTRCRKADTVQWLRQALIQALDLSFNAADLEQLARDGRSAMENKYGDGVLDMLDLFAELLGFSDAPKAFTIPHCRILGRLEETPDGRRSFGPMVIYNQIIHHLVLVDQPADSRDSAQVERITRISQAKVPGDVEGDAVWTALVEMVKM
jgi:hypothetical protein